MIRTSLISLIIIALSTAISSSEKPRFSIVSTSDKQITVDFQNQTSDFLFAYSTNDPENKSTARVLVTPVNNSSIPARLQNVSEGWYNGRYVRWLKISTESSATISGSIFFSADQYSYIPEKVALKNGILDLPGPARLKKSSVYDIPELPFRIGVKVSVSHDGIYAISKNQLKETGVPVDKIDSRTFKLYEKQTEVPLHIIGTTSGALADNSYILFYGRHLSTSSSNFTQYSNTNIYWLTWGDDPGSRCMIKSGARRRDLTLYGTGKDTMVVRAKNFQDTLHFEEDLDIRWLGSISQPADIASAPVADSSIDNWYWGFVGNNDYNSFDIDLPRPAASGTAKLMVSLTGLTSQSTAEFDHSFSILVNDDVPSQGNTVRWNGQNSIVFTTDTFPAKMLLTGKNSIGFLREIHSFEDRAALNWIKVIYTRSYEALDNKFGFKNTPESFNAITQYEIPGFSSRELDVWDTEKYRVFTEFEIQPGSGKNKTGFTLIFQDSISGKTTYLAQTSSKREAPDMLVLDTIKNIWDTLAGKDYYIISTDSFYTELKPLLDIHTSRGLKCAFVSIEDIYNRFSFGIRDPESVRTFLKYIFAISGAHPPRFLLLGGDTTHDLDKKNRGRNVIPTHLSRIPGWGPASDDGYLVTVSGDDNFADLSVGRFPAQNKSEMKAMVDKTVAYIKNPVRGFWRDNILLAGGGKPGETVFTEFNDKTRKEVIGPHMNILRMDADPTSPYYKSEFTASKTMADYINAGVFILNFNGHGGGNVWSDSRFFSYDDLPKLVNGSWGESGKLPIVFSFTCLTGFFESSFYRSLGEEFLRTSQHGAISFYGASAYTSQIGNNYMNRLLLEQGINGSFESIGELISYTEMLMLVQNGPDYIPLIRQYNLLGDPALPWLLTSESLEMSLDKKAVSGDETISLTGSAHPLSNGQVRIQVLASDREWSNHLLPLDKGSFSKTLTLKKDAGTSDGMIRAYAWNDSAELKGWIPFTKDTFMVYDIGVSKDEIALGDSIAVFCRTDLPQQYSDASIYCLYSIEASQASFSNASGILMSKDTTGLYTTNRKISITATEDPDVVLKIKFRVLSAGTAKESSVFSYPVKGRPDLLFAGPISFKWIGDSLVACVQVLNAGSTPSSDFSVVLNWTDESTETPFKTVECKELQPGKSQNLIISLPDTTGALTVSAIIKMGSEYSEIDPNNNETISTLQVVQNTIQAISDSLTSVGGGLTIKPVKKLSKEYRAFLFSEPVSKPAPLKSSSSWAILSQDSIKAFSLGLRPALSTTDSLNWIFKTDKSLEKQQATTATGKLAVLSKDEESDNWRFAGNSVSVGNSTSFHSALPGPFTLAYLTDLKGPEIQLSVAAREVQFVDYIAKDRPFNILISDPSGIFLPSVHIQLNGKELQAQNRSSTPTGSEMENINLTLYPPSERSIDSLSITAQDLAGNVTTTVFAYKPGENLSIKFLSCHPNPFTAKPGPDGKTMQKIRIAFLLSDMASAEMILYTVSGRAIRNWRFTNIIGYQEVEWDGRDREGKRLANGTYYLKLIARNDRKKVKKIIKIVKLEGFR